MSPKPVNARQLEVLQWIADGCPEGVMVGPTFRTSAVALRNRGLVSVSKRGGWHASLNDAGRFYLDHGAYPGSAAQTSKSPEPGEKKHTGPAPSRGEGDVVRSVKTDARKSMKAVSQAPPKEAAMDAKTEPARILVPARLRNPHPVVVALRDDKHRFNVTAGVRNRALRILQGLITALELAGHRVEEVGHSRSSYGYVSWDSQDHFVIKTGETKMNVRVFQQTDRALHTPTPAELNDRKRWGTHPPKYDHTPNDYLRIELERQWGASSRHKWSDGKQVLLEEKLPSILGEVERRHVEARERRIACEHAEEERERQHELAIQRAKILHREAYRARVLDEQLDAWRRSRELREYVRAMKESIRRVSDPAKKQAALEWIRWAQKRVQESDPLNQDLRMPDVPEPKGSDLMPFMPR